MSDRDRLLMQRIAEGDEEAVATLYERFGALVFKVARQLLPTRAEAEDAVQEVFVKLWETAGKYDPSRAKLVTWVMLITRRYLIDQLRRQAARPTETAFGAEWNAPAGACGPEGRPQREEQSEKLRQRIQDLPELQRVVIERAYLQGYTLRQISEQLDAPLGTIKSALSRGLNRLREKGKSDWAV